MSEFPSAQHIASANLKHLTNLFFTASKGRFNRTTADKIREATRKSISSYFPAKSFQLKHTIKLIGELNAEIDEIETEIKKIMDAIDSPILFIPGIGQNHGAIIVAEFVDFSQFENPDKILAFAGCSPSTYQSNTRLSVSLQQLNLNKGCPVRYSFPFVTKQCNTAPLHTVSQTFIL